MCVRERERECVCVCVWRGNGWTRRIDMEAGWGYTRLGGWKDGLGTSHAHKYAVAMEINIIPKRIPRINALTSLSHANFGHGFFLLTEVEAKTSNFSSMIKFSLRAYVYWQAF